MTKKISVDKEILFYAFRYALGRMSYAPSNVIEDIKHNIDEFNVGDKLLIIREIEDCKFLGMEMDRVGWFSLRDQLKESIEKKVLN